MATKNPIILHPCDRAVVYNNLPTFDYVEWAYPVNQTYDLADSTTKKRVKRNHSKG